MGNIVSGGGSSTSGPSPDSGVATVKRGERLNSSVYLLNEPKPPLRPEVEVVFIHGLQPWGFEDAYWKTWLARDGSNDNCWPETWLKSKMPKARILSLSYDSSAIQTASRGTEDVYSLGESLLPNMLLAGIGQNNCPVVFVCHSLGGLVAKQIVLHAKQISSSDQEARARARLLQSVKGFFFYATPHFGSKLVDYAEKLPLGQFKGSVLDYLKVLCEPTARINSEFEKAIRLEFEHWKFYIIAESHRTKVGIFSLEVVSEASARLPGIDILKVQEDHITVCKPKTPTDTSFLKLVQFIETDVMEHRLQLGEIVDLR